MTFVLTVPYAAALTLIYIVLTQLVIMARNKARVPLGDGDNVQLLQAVRRQGNFVENVPLTLLLLALAEAGGSGSATINALGLILLLARIIHPFGLRADAAAPPARIVGSVATTGVQLALVAILALHHFA